MPVLVMEELPLLSSRLKLPRDFCVSYAIFTSSSHHSIDAARRLVFSSNHSTLLLDSLLTTVHIGSPSFLHVFLLSTQSNLSIATSTLNHLHFDGLSVIDSSSFIPNDLYHPSSSTPPLFPKKSLRSVYSNFIEAVRIRLLDDIVSVSSSNIFPTSQPTRLKGGFILTTPSSKNEWSAIWDHRAMARPLLYCQLQIHLIHQCNASPPHFIIHPLLLPTSFLPLKHALPLSPGTPIALLPHGTPAFFLTTYTGPTSALAKQFHESLQGLGVSGWDSSPSPHTHSTTSSSSSSETPMFILAWISVENKKGEDKGIIIIYPAALCLAFISSSPFPYPSPSRPPLTYIPELPAPLQPSPQVPPAVPASNPFLPATSPQSIEPSLPPLAHHRPALPSSTSSDCLRTFRSLTLSRSKDLQLVAIEVGGYVDAVARERERERERLKREREREASGSRTAAPTPTPTSAGGSAPAPAPHPPPPGVLSQTQPLPASSRSQSQTEPSLVQQPQVSTNQTQTPMQQSFYPSPPQTNPPIVPAQTAQTSPVAETNLALPTANSPVESTAVPPSTSTPTTTSASTSTAYDPMDNNNHNNTDSAWSAQPQPYLGMGMDIDMDFGLDIGMGFGMGDGGDTGMDFEDAFTEDDFSFFDRPSTSSGRAAPSGSVSTLTPGPEGKSSTVGTMAAGPGPGAGLAMTPPLFSHDVHSGGPATASSSGSGPGPPLTPLQHQPPTPHSTFNSASHFQASPFDPSALTPHPYSAPPSLLPPSPGLVATPSSNSMPPTPTVLLEPDTPSTTNTRIFDPIPFAAYHRTMDGKYAVGKFSFPFSLPSPLDQEEDFTLQKIDSRKSELVKKNEGAMLGKGKGKKLASIGWRSKYLAATDPRIGVVRKLIGVKRKIVVQGGRDSFGNIHGSKKPIISPSWIREHEDWEKSSSLPKDDVDSKSEADSESEEDENSYAESPIVSRPSTPPPSYLPLGPTLLSTHFEHSQLLPLCTSLRPPGAAVAPTNITSTPAASVPTPVSPAATMGAASEQSKSLEAAALTLATEVVENPPWADAWRTNSLGARRPPEVWPADVRTISQLLNAVPGLESPLDFRTVFGLEAQNQGSSSSKTTQKPQLLEVPKISIGKGDAVIQILPTALRFWEKLGLGPRGGRKNGTMFVLFEDDGEQRQQQVESWLATVSAMYEGRHLGILVPGSCSACAKDGLVPLRFDTSFRKSLTSFIASLPPFESSLIFFIVTPVSTMTLSSPVLRQVFSTVKKALKTHSDAQILFQFVPEQLILSYMGNPSTNFSDLEVFCLSLYDRILLPVDRYVSRLEHRECVRKYFQEPAFTLARPMHNKVSFIRAPRAPLDVMDRHTFVHVGYQISPCGKWILAACVDQRGEAHDLSVWLTQTPGESGESEVEISKEMFLVKKIWEFAVQFAKRANVEWRLVISKLGAMGESEVEAWTNYLGATMATREELPMVHISLLSVEPDAPWRFISRSNINVSPKPKPPSPKHQNNHPQIFTDITATFYAISPRNHLPQSFPPTPADLGLSRLFIPEPLTTPSSSSNGTQHATDQYYPQHLPLRPHSSTTLICVPATPTPTSISMLHIHLLCAIPPVLSMPSPPTATSTADEMSKLHTDITRNFHELAVLAGARWRLGVNPLLPFHLAAVEAMRIALDRDRDRNGWNGVDE